MTSIPINSILLICIICTLVPLFCRRNWRCLPLPLNTHKQRCKLTPHISVTQEMPEELTHACTSYRLTQTCIYVHWRQNHVHRVFISYMLWTRSPAFIVSSTHIDQARVVSLSQVVQHRGFVETGEVGHVLHFAEARGVHPLHLLPGQSHLPLAVC